MAQSDEDPRERPAPEGPFEERVIALAKDLAYGVKVGDWEPSFLVIKYPSSEWMTSIGGQKTPSSKGTPLDVYLERKWSGGSHPMASFLEAIGYVERVLTAYNNSDTPNITYILTPKAMKLLEEPAVAPSAFIAYSRQPSSAFALLIETRLKERGIPAFLDRQIEAGEDWENKIQTTIQQQINKFICVIAPDTLKSQFVQSEIRWALEANLELPIPIWHRGFKGTPQQLEDCDDVIKDFVTRKNAIRVLEESAQAYDSALSLLLNQLGYATGESRLFE